MNIIGIILEMSKCPGIKCTESSSRKAFKNEQMKANGFELNVQYN